MPKNLPPPEFLCKILSYDPETGLMIWKERDCTSAKRPKSWNTKNAGRVAFTAQTPNGYYCGAIMNRRMLAHRVIWAIVYGEWPSDQIDHINGIQGDNRIENLRLASDAINRKNMPMPMNNSSGRTGVGMHNQTKKWRAYINSEGKNYALGLYERFEDAVAARVAAEKKFGFHSNSGRIQCLTSQEGHR